MGIPVVFPTQVSAGIIPLSVGREENQFRLFQEPAEPLPTETPGRGPDPPESAASQHRRWEFSGNGGVGSMGMGLDLLGMEGLEPISKGGEGDLGLGNSRPASASGIPREAGAAPESLGVSRDGFGAPWDCGRGQGWIRIGLKIHESESHPRCSMIVAAPPFPFHHSHPIPIPVPILIPFPWIPSPFSSHGSHSHGSHLILMDPMDLFPFPQISQIPFPQIPFPWIYSHGSVPIPRVPGADGGTGREPLPGHGIRGGEIPERPHRGAPGAGIGNVPSCHHPAGGPEHGQGPPGTGNAGKFWENPGIVGKSGDSGKKGSQGGFPAAEGLG